jgi:putative glycosyl hydrolase
MTTPSSCRSHARLLAIGLLICAGMLTSSAAAGAAPQRRAHSSSTRHRGPVATAARLLPPALASAAATATSADRVLVSDARTTRECQRAHGASGRACGGARRALQLAGDRFASAERGLARLARDAGKGSRARSASTHSSPRLAPQLIVSGETLSWTRVDAIKTYVLVRKVPGQPDRYSVLRGTSATPPAVPGTTVRYSVRTTAWWSAWSREKSISYPRVTPGGGRPPHAPAEAPGKAPANPPGSQAAPAISVSGQTLSWNATPGVSTYVLVRRVPGQPDQYSEVTGTSIVPPAVPGATVHYSVRSAVQGSAWSTEVSIAYPASVSSPAPPPPVSPPPPSEGPSQGSSGMTVALDIGGWDWASAVNDEATAVRYVRSSYKHFDSDSQMELLAKAGVTLMPLFGEGGTLAGYDNSAFFGEIVAWFKRYGKGGTFWAGKPVDLGATTAELINEPGNPYFYPDYNNTQLYAEMTKAVHSALEANFAAAVRPKLLVSYDGGFNGSAYGRAIFAAGAVADGVTVHPYGGHGSESALGGRERVTQAHGETGLPVYVTEVGWPTAVGQAPTGDSLQWNEQQQAENVTRFIQWTRSLGYVNDVTYFNYADYGSNDFYGVVNTSGSSHKLAFYALKAAAAAS